MTGNYDPFYNSWYNIDIELEKLEIVSKDDWFRHNVGPFLNDYLNNRGL